MLCYKRVSDLAEILGANCILLSAGHLKYPKLSKILRKFYFSYRILESMGLKRGDDGIPNGTTMTRDGLKEDTRAPDVALRVHGRCPR